MNEYHRSRTTLTLLIVCLCVGSLLALPAGDHAGGTLVEFFELEIENGDLSDHAESDDVFGLTFIDTSNVDLLLLKSCAADLGFPNLRLSPVSPPPNKHN